MDKSHAKGMADHFAALNAAYASYAAGEEGAEDKLAEAHTGHLKAVGAHCGDKMFASFMDEGEAGKDPLSEGAISGGAYAEGSQETELAEQPEHELQHTKPPGASLDASFADAGTAEAKAYRKLTGKVGQLTDMVEKLAKANSAYAGKLARLDFHAECDGLRKENYQLPAQVDLDEQWESCFSSTDPKKALATLGKLLKSFPQQQSPADFNAGQPIFGVNGASAPKRNLNQKQTEEEVMQELHDLTGHSFSASDIKLGDAWADAIGTALGER